MKEMADPKDLVLSEEDVKRFLSMMPTGPPDECWPWPHPRNAEGYGLFRCCRRILRAHRVAFHVFCGPLPAGLLVLHRCDNPPCVNWTKHLFSGTAGENAADRDAKGRSVMSEEARRNHMARVPRGERANRARHPERYPIGEAVKQSKLTEARVAQIRRAYATGVSSYKLADEFGVSRPTIMRAVNRKTWKHVD